jgi:dTDP-4-dehydrorhamnose 3,5-epimerase
LRAGAMRGMHFQRAPHAEVKLIRCVRGAIYDVIVDAREDSPSYLRWFGAELSEANGLAMYVPRGFAHGFQALSDGASIFYLVSAFYAPEAEGGLRFDDPKLAIEWPRAVADISEKDARWPFLAP